MPYDEGSYVASPPPGWAQIENAVHEHSYVESRWRDPQHADRTVLIDMSPASGLAPAAAAAPVLATLRREPGYHEVSFGPGQLPQGPSAQWVFTLPGSERVDYFFSQCGFDFAVLGVSPPADFASLLPTFDSFAQSVRGTCGT